MSNYLDICQDALALATKLGASDAKCSVSNSDSMSISAYEGKSSGIESGSEQGLSIVVYVGQKSASASTNLLDKASVEAAVKFAFKSALLMPEDKYSGLADVSMIAKPTAAEIAALDLVDSSEKSVQDMLQMAIDLEAATRSVNGVKTIRSADVSQGLTSSYVAATNGFVGVNQATSRFISTSAVAERGDLKQTDGEYSVARHWSDVESVLAVGQAAGESAVKMLNTAELGVSGKYPVILEKEIAAQLLLGNLVGCLKGGAISKNASFINKGDLGAKLFGDNITLMDNRSKVRGLTSSPFTGQGLKGPDEATIIQDGSVENFLLGVRDSRKLGLTPELGRPSLYNAYFKPGDVSKDGLASGVKTGLYVTDVMGHGFDAVTGNVTYTVGGYAIRDGHITDEYVIKATLAGNLKDMLNNVTFANDLEFKRASNCSTALVEGMTIS